MDTPSYKRHGEGYNLTSEEMRWFIDSYTPEVTMRKEPFASPLLAVSHSRLPPAVIITAEYDPLHDDGLLYAKQLKDAGVEVYYKSYSGMVHSFFQMNGEVEAARIALDETIKQIKRGEYHLYTQTL